MVLDSTAVGIRLVVEVRLVVVASVLVRVELRLQLVLVHTNKRRAVAQIYLGFAIRRKK